MIKIDSPNNLYKNNVGFRAIPLAEYGYLKNQAKKVVVYQLEKKDIGYLENISKNLDSFYKKFDVDNLSAKQVLEEAVNAGIQILKADKPQEKRRVFLCHFMTMSQVQFL